MKRHFWKPVIALGLFCLAAQAQQTQAALPRVLLIGDSISIGYTPATRKLLEGKAIVEHNPGNAGHTGLGLEKLEEWLGTERWDVIHFNWGLWDLAYRPNGSKVKGLDKVNGSQTWSTGEYEAHLRTLVGRLRKTGARLIWATITPVPEGEPGRFKGDEVRYNGVADKVMRGNGIVINDLYSYMLPHAKSYQIKEGDVHFTPEGSEFLARKVAAAILEALGEKQRD